VPRAKPIDPLELTSSNIATPFLTEADAWLTVEWLRWSTGTIRPHSGVIGSVTCCNARKIKDGQRTERGFGQVAGKRLMYRGS
jgi:hypothetical protein